MVIQKSLAVASLFNQSAVGEKIAKELNNYIVKVLDRLTTYWFSLKKYHKMKKNILLSLSCTLMFMACKKDDQAAPANLTGSDLLMSGKWQITAEMQATTVDGTPTAPVDRFAGRRSCDKDNYTLFRTDAHWIIDEGAAKCENNAQQQQDLGTWTLIDNHTRLSLSSGSGSSVHEVLQLDNAVLKIKYTQAPQNFNGSVYVTTTETTYKHIK